MQVQHRPRRARRPPGRGADLALLRLRSDGRQPARRQPDRAAGAAPLPGRGPPPGGPRRRGDGMVGDPSGRSGSATCSTTPRSAPTWPPSRPRSPAPSTSNGRRATGRQPGLDRRRHACSTSLRDVGKHVTVNQMLARESVKARLAGEHGISYTEFSHMLLQAHEYLQLYRTSTSSCRSAGPTSGATSGPASICRAGGGHHGPCPGRGRRSPPDGSKLGKTTGAQIWLDLGLISPVPVLPVLSRRPTTASWGALGHSPSRFKGCLVWVTAEHLGDASESLHGSAGWPTRRPASSTWATRLRRRRRRGDRLAVLPRPGSDARRSADEVLTATPQGRRQELRRGRRFGAAVGVEAGPASSRRRSDAPSSRARCRSTDRGDFARRSGRRGAARPARAGRAGRRHGAEPRPAGWPMRGLA